jgi:hypothetical protein
VRPNTPGELDIAEYQQESTAATSLLRRRINSWPCGLVGALLNFHLYLPHFG